MTKKTSINIKDSNSELIQNLQRCCIFESGKKVSTSSIIDVAVSEFFNKYGNLQNEEEVNYLKLVEVLKCYNLM